MKGFQCKKGLSCIQRKESSEQPVAKRSFMIKLNPLRMSYRLSNTENEKAEGTSARYDIKLYPSRLSLMIS